MFGSMNSVEQQTHARKKTYWRQMMINAALVFLGQSVSTILESFYYSRGGKSFLLAAFLENAGFPILVPFAIYFLRKEEAMDQQQHQPSKMVKALVFVGLGLIQAASSMLYSIGLRDLPVSTFSLVSTTQIGFNALFSFILNKQKYTPPIVNSLVIIAISSVLTLQHGDHHSENHATNNGSEHFVSGFVCTLAASALYSFEYSLAQLFFENLLKRETVSMVINTTVYQSLVATLVAAGALCISGEWSVLQQEMMSFESGTAVYLIILTVISISWQVFGIGAIGLVFQVSSLFSNVISAASLPFLAAFGAVFFQEKMDGIQGISIFWQSGDLLLTLTIIIS